MDENDDYNNLRKRNIAERNAFVSTFVWFKFLTYNYPVCLFTFNIAVCRIFQRIKRTNERDKRTDTNKQWYREFRKRTT